MTFDHAVVVGASVAGLLSAGAAATRFDHVTVIERDELPTTPSMRPGTPQASQVHALLPFGLDRMESVFPGVGADFRSAGATPYDDSRDMAVLLPTGWRRRTTCIHSRALGLRRPLLEHLLRERLLALPNVSVLNAFVDGLDLAEDDNRVTGVR